MPKIEVNTTQNVSIEYETAGFLWRFVAWMLDTALISVVYILCYYFFLNRISNIPKDFLLYLNIIIYILLNIFYSLFIEIWTNGQSIGKKIVGIVVIKLNGNALEIYDYIIRWAYRVIDFGFTFYSLGTISILMSEKNQRFGDMIANSTVVKLRQSNIVTLEDLENLPDKDDYQPKYPKVVLYSDDEMLTIKNLLTRYQQNPNQKYENLINQTAKRLQTQMELPPTSNNLTFLREVIHEYVILSR